MAKKKVADTQNVQKISSRNRNKNKNRNLQIRAKEKELAKKEKAKKAAENILENEDDVEAEVETMPIKTEVPVRDKVVIVPERKVVAEDNDIDEDDDDEDGTFVKIKTDRFATRNIENTEANGSDKFTFVDDTSEDNIMNHNEADALEEFLEYDNVESVPVKEIKQLERTEVEDKEEIEKEIPRPTDNVDINAKTYFSFENRIIALLVLIVVSFFIAGLLIFKAVTYSDTDAIVFDEKSSASYQVCVRDNSEYYSNECLDAGMEYISDITENIPFTFNYEMKFNQAVSTKVSYYVVSKVNIYREKNGKVLNTMEDVLVERTSHDIFGDTTEFSIDVDVPFKEYGEYVDKYNTQYGIDGYADLEVIFYVDNGNVIKKVSEAKLSLSTETFSIALNDSLNVKQNLNVPNNSWGNINTSYAVVGVIFVLFGVIGIIRLANLVFKVIGTSSMYQRSLGKILREYDRYIVISRGDYIIDDTKKLIKVTTFGELLDARNTLEKPIVYVKINNVKSEFYVEDSEIVYKYTIKEADFEGK